MKTEKIHQDVWIGIKIIALCVLFFGVNAKLRAESGMMPRLLLGIMILLGGLLIAQGYKKTRAATEQEPVVKMLSLQSMKVPAVTYLYIVGYVVLFRCIGYFVATPIFLLALIRHLKIKSWKLPILVTVIYLAIIYLFFVKQLNVSVDDLGLLGDYLSVNR